mmetsp:Transcript_4262/g.10136  ORF Transcript_4262/g.10136 Transcript_4262/m.10136 type:complete len:205 (-) Transcript_4262:540-1154(-)
MWLACVSKTFSPMAPALVRADSMGRRSILAWGCFFGTPLGARTKAQAAARTAEKTRRRRRKMEKVPGSNTGSKARAIFKSPERQFSAVPKPDRMGLRRSIPGRHLQLKVPRPLQTAPRSSASGCSRKIPAATTANFWAAILCWKKRDQGRFSSRCSCCIARTPPLKTSCDWSSSKKQARRRKLAGLQLPHSSRERATQQALKVP